MRVLFFDCISGISGDMALGALIGAGADPEQIRKHLDALPLEPFDLVVGEVETHGITATRVQVHTNASAVIRTYANIRQLIDETPLPADAKLLAQRIFRRLADAEAVVHRREAEQVTFHEVGAVDSIVDIVGTALAMTMLGVDRVFSSPVPTGMGMVRTDHGMTPIPAPAVLELLRGVPLYSRPVPMELVTPTGAAILATTVEGFGDMPMLRTEAIGYGSGQPRTDFPNVARVIIGEEAGTESAPFLERRISGEVVVATNVDDLSPELSAYVIDQLFDAGAQDAWLTPIVMKKGRPAVTISVLCDRHRVEAISRVLFRETGTLGVRTSPVDKRALERDTITVATRYGEVRVKLGILDGAIITVAPEYEDCAAIARAAGVPARDVYEDAVRRARQQLGDDEPTSA